jgi:hypothetical protein
VAARREQHVDPGAVLDSPDGEHSVEAERDLPRRWRAAREYPIEQPQRDSCTTPPRAMPRVDNVSLGCTAWSTSPTSWPARASSSAVAAPAQRDPTITTS